jgi:hypothetical protein
MAERQFHDEDHALRVGLLAGTLAKAGVDFNIARDALGNYKPFMEIVIPEWGEVEPLRITVQVMPGPENHESEQ